MNEIIDRTCCINKQDCTVHSSADNFAGKLKPFLSGCTKNMDVRPVYLNSAVIECNGCGPASTHSFHVAGCRIKGLYQCCFSHTKRSEDHNFTFFILIHQEKCDGWQFYHFGENTLCGLRKK